MAMRRRWTDEQLIEAVPKVTSMGELLPLLGLAPRTNRVLVKAAIERLKLNTSHWYGQGWLGKKPHPRARPLEELLIKDAPYKISHLRPRLLRSGLKEWRCESCSLTEWQGGPIPLEIDHINGVNNDHRIENLRLLCPNCHALTPTWRGRKRAKNYRAPEATDQS